MADTAQSYTRSDAPTATCGRKCQRKCVCSAVVLPGGRTTAGVISTLTPRTSTGALTASIVSVCRCNQHTGRSGSGGEAWTQHRGQTLVNNFFTFPQTGKKTNSAPPCDPAEVQGIDKSIAVHVLQNAAASRWASGCVRRMPVENVQQKNWEILAQQLLLQHKGLRYLSFLIDQWQGIQKTAAATKHDREGNVQTHFCHFQPCCWTLSSLNVTESVQCLTNSKRIWGVKHVCRLLETHEVTFS